MLPAAHPRRSIEGEVWGEWNAARFSPTARWKVSETLIFTLLLLQPYFSFLFWASLGFLNSNIPIVPTSKLKLHLVKKKKSTFSWGAVVSDYEEGKHQRWLYFGLEFIVAEDLLLFLAFDLLPPLWIPQLPISSNEPTWSGLHVPVPQYFPAISASLPFLPPNFACSITFVVQGLQTLMSFVF